MTEHMKARWWQIVLAGVGLAMVAWLADEALTLYGVAWPR